MADWRESELHDAPEWLAQRGGELTPIPTWQRKVINAVVTDVQESGPISLRFACVLEDDRQSMTLFAWVDGEQGASGTGLNPHRSHVERLVDFAGWLQEQVIWESVAAWGEARPLCPGHPHPAKPDVVGGDAWWVCPQNRRQIALIGQYSRTSTPT